MRHEMFKFLSIQRQIFGVCPCCSEIFRVSDGTVYLKKKPSQDWHDRLKNSERRVEKQEERINDEEASLRKIAREKGRDYYALRSDWLAFAKSEAAKGNPPKNAGAAFVAYCGKQDSLR